MEVKAINRKSMIGWIVAVVLTLFVMLMPVTELFTAPVRTFLSVTLFFVVAMIFELLPNFIIATLLPAAYVVTGIVSIPDAFSSYASQNVWMALGAFVLGNVMEQTGLLNRISYSLIRAMGGSFKGAVWGAFLAAFIVNFITFGAGWVIGFPLIIGIVKAMKLKPGKESALICFAGLVGAVDSGCFIYVPSSQAWLDSFIQPVLPDFVSTFFTPLLYNGFLLVGGVAFLAIMIRSVEKKAKKDGSASDIALSATKEYFDELYKGLGKISKNEIKSFALFVILLAYTIYAGYANKPIAYGFMIVPYLAFLPFIGCDNGESLKKTQFQGLFFYASCVAIGSVGALVGFTNMLATVLLPLMEGKSNFVSSIIIILSGTVTKLALTPSALLAGFGGAVAQIAATIGMHPAAAVYLLFSCSCYIFFPFGITGYLLVYSSGYVPMKEFMKNQVLKIALSWLAFAVIFFPLWNVFGMI